MRFLDTKLTISAMLDTSSTIVLNVAAIALFFKLTMTAVNAILALLWFLNHDVLNDDSTVLKNRELVRPLF
jgi:hypothetical protein